MNDHLLDELIQMDRLGLVEEPVVRVARQWEYAEASVVPEFKISDA